MENFGKAALLFACVSIAGCAAQQLYWTKPGTSRDEFNSDMYQCQQAAVQSYPVVHSQVMTSPGVNVPAQPQVRTTCTPQFGGGVTCTSQPVNNSAAMFNRPPTYITVDVNDANRAEMATSCMYARGYSLQPR